MKFVNKQLLQDVHKPGWSGYWLALGYGVFFFALFAGVWWALAESRYALLVPMVLAQAFIMHAYLLAFHEAAHGSLCPVGFINGYLGRVTGLFSFTSLTLYRAVHHWHHAYLGTQRDEEFWPYTDSREPRWKRQLAVFMTLTCSLVWTPAVLLRAFVRRDSAIREPRVRRLIWIELLGGVAFWSTVTVAAIWFDVWLVLVIGYLVPAYLAANVQSLRQLVEHMGLTAKHNIALTRSVRNPSLAGRLVSWLLFREPYHDVHHLYPKVPQEAIPVLAEAMNPLPPELPVFRSYRAAFADLLPHLRDPKFGKEWIAETPAAANHNSTIPNAN